MRGGVGMGACPAAGLTDQAHKPIRSSPYPPALAAYSLGLMYLGLVIEDLATRGKSLQYNNSELTRILRPGEGEQLGGPWHRCPLGCRVYKCFRQGTSVDCLVHTLLRVGFITFLLSSSSPLPPPPMPPTPNPLAAALGGQGGNALISSCNTLMLGCISPMLAHVDRTRHTLEYMEKAGSIRNEVSACGRVGGSGGATTATRLVRSAVLLRSIPAHLPRSTHSVFGPATLIRTCASLLVPTHPAPLDPRPHIRACRCVRM